MRTVKLAYGQTCRGKVTTVTLVEIPYQDTLNVRKVDQCSLLWYDQFEPEIEKKKVEEGSESSEDELDDNEDGGQAEHIYYRDTLSKELS